jgi:hypothetical protein
MSQDRQNNMQSLQPCRHPLTPALQASGLICALFSQQSLKTCSYDSAEKHTPHMRVLRLCPKTGAVMPRTLSGLCHDVNGRARGGRHTDEDEAAGIPSNAPLTNPSHSKSYTQAAAAFISHLDVPAGLAESDKRRIRQAADVIC